MRLLASLDSHSDIMLAIYYALYRLADEKRYGSNHTSYLESTCSRIVYLYLICVKSFRLQSLHTPVLKFKNKYIKIPFYLLNGFFWFIKILLAMWRNIQTKRGNPITINPFAT